MKRTIVTALAALFAASALAEEPKPLSNTKVQPLFTNVFGIGLQTFEVDTNSSKFEEYRSVPEGILGPDFRIFTQKDPMRILATGHNVGQDDRRFDLRAENRAIGVDVYYDQIPHRIGNDARSILVRAAKDSWAINDVTQQALQSAIEARPRSTVNFAFLSTLVQPLLAAPYIYDLGFDRRRGGLSLQILPESPINTRVTYFREQRSDTRPAGTSFGFGNVVETGEPIDYVTEDVGVRLEMPLKRGLVRGGITINRFNNRLQSYTFDNPFRATDSTDANAYQAPGTASVNGPAFGRMSLAPDSDQLLLTAGGMYKLPRNSRITADVTWSRLTSDDSLIPLTTNTAIVLANGLRASDPLSLPDRAFDGEINSLRTTLAFNSRPIPGLGLNARLRYYDLENESERVRFPDGYVRFDSAYQPIARITVPYGWTNTRLDLYSTYDLRLATLEAGFRHDVMERTFRETEETTENIFHLATDVRPFTWAVFRASYEFGDRDFDEYDSERSEDASFLNPQAPANLPELRRYDQAKRDTSRIVGMLQLTPLDSISLSGNYVRYFDDYTGDSTHGLLTWRNNSMTLEADYTPTAKLNLFAFFTHDEWSTFQRGRQSGATPDTDPRNDWTAHHIDKANTYGLGTNVTFIPDKLVLRLNGSVQKVSGYNNLESPPGGTLVDVAMDIPNIDDTSLLSASAELTYTLSDAWHLAAGAWYEDYDIFDMLSTGTQGYMPAAFFLIPNDASYRGSALYVRTSYRF